ncbi:MAG: hypothetical protein COA78_36865 [Blastopirellula sp.]|nr:MAG: hypothetical protein COA78_36865 [Blastopirellula sp.]
MIQLMTGGAQMEPGVPTASKHGIAIGYLAALVGSFCISMPTTQKPTYSKRRRASASINLPDQVSDRLSGMENADNDDV